MRCRRANRISARERRLGRRVTRVRVRPCNNVHTVAASMSFATRTTAARSMHGWRRRLLVACEMSLARSPPARGGRRFHWLKFRGSAARPPTALNGNPVRRRSSGTGTGRTCAAFCMMRYEVRSGVAGRDASSMRRIGLRQCLTDRAEHRERYHYAPHGNPHRCARSLRRACAVFRWDVAPLRHHHFKFLRWPRSRRAFSAYPQDPRSGSTDSDARQANHHHT